MAVQFTKLSVSPEVVQTTGTSETAVMSQKAVTDALASSGGSSGGSSVGSEPVTLTFNTVIFPGETNYPNNTTGGGIFKSSVFSYSKEVTIQLSDADYNTFQNQINNYKRVFIDINGSNLSFIIENHGTLSSYGDVYMYTINQSNMYMFRLYTGGKSLIITRFSNNISHKLNLKLNTITFV